MQQVTLQVNGMSCGHCVSAVKKALSDIPGVQVDNVVIGKAVISYNADKVSASTITEAIKDAGYEAYATP